MGEKDNTELRMNLAAVKKYDPYAKDIIDTSSHVAFYTFNSEGNEWEKTNVEGAFFVYSRNAEPYHSIFVNNRLNTCNLVEPITSEIEIQPQPPFLLYRNERTKIRGFWFYNTQECDRVAELVGKLVENCKKTKQLEHLKSKNMSNNGVDIFSMLSKAQEDFNNSMGTGIQSTTSSIKSEVQVNSQADVTSSVLNFFAAAKPNPPEVPRFQRMLSNPLHVEQIEKQQRAVSPEQKQVSPLQNKHIKHIPLQQLQQKNTSISNPKLGALNQNIPSSLGPVENGLKFIRINSPIHNPPELGPSPLATFLNSSNLSSTVSRAQNKPPVNATDLSDIESRQKPLNQLLRKQSEPAMITSPGKPALLLPTMFVSPSSGIPSSNMVQIVSATSSNTQMKDQIINTSSDTLTNHSSIPTHNSFNQRGKPEPLTQSQLLQAMSYLIKNDPEFIKKLHEAYLKSFTEMMSL